MVRADLSTPRPLRIGVAITVLLFQLLVVLVLVRAFAPDFSAAVVRQVTQAFTVTVTTRPSEPIPEKAAAEAQGAAGRKAIPRDVAAPRPRVAIAEKAAPQVASTGIADRSGASSTGMGTGAGGTGSGPGGGTASKAEKIAGDINSARDYPRETRDLRIDDYVIVVLTVGADGTVKACRIQRPSRDAQADRITCDLATQRFRFRPATDALGKPVESTFGWKQRWFYPERK